MGKAIYEYVFIKTMNNILFFFYSDMGCQDSVSRGKQPWLVNKVLNYSKKKEFLLIVFKEISLEAAIQ